MCRLYLYKVDLDLLIYHSTVYQPNEIPYVSLIAHLQQPSPPVSIYMGILKPQMPGTVLLKLKGPSIGRLLAFQTTSHFSSTALGVHL